jgi:PAS domain-containing protein
VPPERERALRSGGPERGSVPAVAEQHPVELILARGLVSNLTTAAFVVDGEGTVVFFNEPAGDLLGVRYEEAGPMTPEEWRARFTPTDLEGQPLALSDLPLAAALRGRAAHAPLRIRAASGREHDLEVTAFPLPGRSGHAGAVALFWDRAS